MSWRSAKSVLLLSVLATVLVPAHSPAEMPGMWLTGYYPIWAPLGMPAYHMPWRGMTHVVHFGINPSATPPYWMTNSADSVALLHGYGFVNRWGRQESVADTLVKYAHLNGAKVILSCGGIWGEGATNMNMITSDSGRTQVFTDRLVAFARQHRYDGIEIDYEPPQSKAAMSLLIRILKRRMTAVMGPEADLLIAAANSSLDRYDVGLVRDSIAQFNLMMYDMGFVASGWCYSGCAADVIGHNAPLRSPDSTRYPALWAFQHSYDGTVGDAYPDGSRIVWLSGNRQLVDGPRKWIASGMPAKKIGMGIPFYGYAYNMGSSYAGIPTPGSPRSGVWAQWMEYPTIMKYLELGGTRYWDGDAKVPWMSGTASQSISWKIPQGVKFFISYDDTASVRHKVEYARELGLGGIMAYSLMDGYEYDAPPGLNDPLLKAVRGAMGDSVGDMTSPRGSLSASPTHLPPGGGRVTLRWNSVNGRRASVNHGVGEVPLGGSIEIDVPSSATFILTIVGNDSRSVALDVRVEVEKFRPNTSQDITSRGAIVSMVTSPRGAGSKDLEVIRDGVIPQAGSTDPSTQFDTYTDGSARAEDWIGYSFPKAHVVRSLFFQEGLEFPEGGWFDQFRVQVHRNGQWVDVEDTRCFPPYPGRNGVGYEEFSITFAPVLATGVRIIGVPGGAGRFVSVGELRVLENTPPVNDYRLEQNFPNPFNPETTLKYYLPVEAKVNLTVYNVLGEEVARLVDESQSAGTYALPFDARNLPTGVYFAVLRANDYNDVRKLVLLR